jgi:Tfp pilus assembly protein PilN
MININLIADRRAKKVREKTIVRLSGLAIVIVLIAMLGMNGYAYYTLISAQREDDRISLTLDSNKVKYDELLVIQQRINDMEPRVKLLKQVRVSEAAWMTILRDVSRVIPDTIVLDSITAASSDNGIVLRLNGKARDQDAVASFMERLRVQTAWADKPSTGAINSIQTGNVPGVAFDLTVPVRELVGGEL